MQPTSDIAFTAPRGRPSVSRAIWTIIYDLAEEGRDTYLAWFHDVHIPEKLARPGYRWAAHYQVVTRAGKPTTSLGGRAQGSGPLGYIAMFGGTDTSTFLHPSPAQIKPRQTVETRAMMGLRIGQRSFIATEEWCTEATGNQGRHAHPLIELTCCDVARDDESFGAWCVQELMPALMQSADVCAVSKMLATSGPMKHAVLAEFAAPTTPFYAQDRLPRTEWAARVNADQRHIPGSPFLARRIWPALVAP